MPDLVLVSDAAENDAAPPGAMKHSVALLTLNESDRLNPLTVAMGQAMVNAVHELKTRASLRAVVLTGSGRAFSAGGDLDFLQARCADNERNNVREMLAFYRRFLSVRDIGVPLIAAVNGHAIGAGFCLALACDVRFVLSSCKVGLNFVRLGLHPGMAASHFAPMRSPNRGADWLLSGDIRSGQRAADDGLCHRAFDTNVLGAALEHAFGIAGAAPIAVRDTLASVRHRENLGLDDALQNEAEAQARSYASEDLKRGLEAVKNRTAPVFLGD